MSCLSESFLSEIPEKASDSLLSEVFLPKVFRPKVFDFNVCSFVYVIVLFYSLRSHLVSATQV